jgi:hypothetical protein
MSKRKPALVSSSGPIAGADDARIAAGAVAELGAISLKSFLRGRPAQM